MTSPIPSTDAPAPAHGQLKATLVVLEELLDTLTETTNSAEALRATVETTREGVEAEVAFWYSKGGAKATAIAGVGPLSAEQYVQFARKLVTLAPAGQEVFRWANPDGSSPERPAAALVAR